MKKIFFFLSAIALLGLTAACVEQQPVNPNYDAATNSVKTAFAINVMTEAQTKATAAQVQATSANPFLGMDGMTVYPLSAEPTSANSLTATSVTPINLGSVTTADIYGTGDADRSSKIYNIQITTGTNNMVFYGHAPETETSYGKLVKDGVNWSLQSIATDAFGTESTAIATALNSVLTANWKAAVAYFTNNTNANSTDYQILIDLYNNLKPKANEVRQGSGEAVETMVTDLYNNLNLFKDVAVSTAPDGATIDSPKAIATAVVNAIKNNFTVSTASSTTGGGETTVALKANRTFPTDLKLPFGAAQLVWDDNNNQFKFATGPDSFYGNATISNVSKFVYPASLYYWVNSPVRVSSSESLTYPTTTATWDAENWTSGSWVKNGTVSAETRGVALQYNIQYATALLESTVAYGENVTALTDNYAALHPAQQGETTAPSNQSITVDANSFQLKGIIIGGQPATVDWNWIMKSGVAVDNVVYDAPASPMAIPASGASEKFYTLLLDNYGTGANGGQAQKVPVALELVNNTGKDFWGRDNMIPAGGTFYLVGNLDLAAASGTLSFASTDVSRAPYLTGQGTPRVFMQDYKTIATFTIGATSLQKAYSTIPDLRSTMLTFGISVDLVWKAGYTFTVDL